MFSTGSSVVDKLAAMNPWRPQEPPAENPQGPPDESSEEPAEKPPYQPTPVDIQVAWKMVTAATKFPSDIVDDILDHAEYWAHSSNYIDFQEEHQAQLRIAGTSKMENRFLLRSLPVGLIALGKKKSLTEQLQYDMTEAQPEHLKSEHDPSFFTKLAKYPTPRLVHPVRKVVFSIKSHDQGWGGAPGHKGTYEGSHTWFDAGLERFDAEQECDSQCTFDVRFESPKSVAPPLPLCALRPIDPPIMSGNVQPGEEPKNIYNHVLGKRPEWHVQSNKTATRALQESVVTWSWVDDIDPESEEAQALEEQGRGKATGNGELIRTLKLGDVITLWGKARFPGWANFVERVQIDVYWAV